MQAKTLIFDTTSNHKLICDACGGPIGARAPIRITIFVGSVSRNRVTHRPACSAQRGNQPGKEIAIGSRGLTVVAARWVRSLVVVRDTVDLWAENHLS